MELRKNTKTLKEEGNELQTQTKIKNSKKTIQKVANGHQKGKNDDYQLVIKDILKHIYIMPNLKGYRYIIDAIEMVIKDRTLIDSITTVIYPEIAKKYNTISSGVERCIRHAIENAFSYGNKEKIKEIFGENVLVKKGKPTNAQFIAMLVDYITFMQNHKASDGEEKEMEDDYQLVIKDTLTNMAITPELKGYRYIVDAVEITIKNRNIIYSITKEIYTKIAEKYNTTPSRVERCIRHVIEKAFNYGNKEKIKEIFGESALVKKGKATNLEFIAIIAEYINIMKNKKVADGESKSSEENYQLVIRDILKDIAIMPKLKGYIYIIEAVEINIKDKSAIHLVTKEIYPEVAKNNNTSSANVERAIRHAIENAFRYGNKEKIKEIFGENVLVKKAKTTNTEFIAGISEYITMMEN